MSARLEGRFALLTGAGRGLGVVIAEGLAVEGANVAVHYRTSLSGAKETAARIRDLGREAVLVQGDIGSRVVVEGSPRAPQYAAAKYAILGISKSYAHALAPYVRVNTIGPGFVETQTLRERQDWRTGRREAVLARTPLARIPTQRTLSRLSSSSPVKTRVTSLARFCSAMVPQHWSEHDKQA